jgi:hypothetical protein
MVCSWGAAVLHDLLEVHGGDDAWILGVHADPGDLVDVEDRDVEGLFGLVLEGTVDAAVLGVEVQVAEAAGEPFDRPDGVALQIRLDQNVGERVVDVPVFLIDGDALNVSGVPGPGVSGCRVVLDGQGRLRMGGRPLRVGGCGNAQSQASWSRGSR